VDELSARYKVREVAAHQAEQGWDLDWSRRLLNQYDDLVEQAQEIARVVFALRWPRAGEYSFDISFSEEYRDGGQHVTATYFTRGENDSFAFPLHYLFATYEQIVTAEDILKDEAAAAHAEKLRAAQEESRRRDIETLKRLQERYPEVGYRRDA